MSDITPILAAAALLGLLIWLMAWICRAPSNIYNFCPRCNLWHRKDGYATKIPPPTVLQGDLQYCEPCCCKGAEDCANE